MRRWLDAQMPTATPCRLRPPASRKKRGSRVFLLPSPTVRTTVVSLRLRCGTFGLGQRYRVRA